DRRVFGTNQGVQPISVFPAGFDHYAPKNLRSELHREAVYSGPLLKLHPSDELAEDLLCQGLTCRRIPR
ncbi:MAG TPA: hypothetical protein P5568_06800, partial [Acidobacteriota bacterium]|nr:hypothetical protein [Acidobacteriota bacterium]